MTPHEQLIHDMARGVRKQQFARIRRHAVFDETLPPSEQEIADARAALAVVREALRVVTPEMTTGCYGDCNPFLHKQAKAFLWGMLRASAITPENGA